MRTAGDQAHNLPGLRALPPRILGTLQPIHALLVPLIQYSQLYLAQVSVGGRDSTMRCMQSLTFIYLVDPFGFLLLLVFIRPLLSTRFPVAYRRKAPRQRQALLHTSSEFRHV